MNNLFMQIQPMTYDEKKAIYMKLSKDDLVKMLIECNRIIESYYPIVIPSDTQPYPMPWTICQSNTDQ